ncbi:hypothetical protein [Sphingobacterium athyrii]|uniref:Uncharacterized protein n=1 Tax=Sphingobacterium athyrii TaxID=2152717 RepID=A0A363NUY6_9SPHI|nr:hypothetical protein [Sphingobacterium athyrii]PUV24461.1 hypothetical protein DCO56_14040 [Sphingobacterium athyrii]
MAQLLSLKDEGIYAISPETSFEQKIKIAGSFTHFVRGLGTAFNAKREKEHKEFLELSENEFNLDSIIFWKNTI